MNRLKLLVRSFVALSILLLAGVALAQVSSNFDLGWHILSGGGGERTSANYVVQDTLGQQIAGLSSSTNARIESGFWHEVDSTTPTPTPTHTPAPPTDTPTPTHTPAPPTGTPTPTHTPTSAGDAYEDDDSCAGANTISTNGSTQAHTFHDAGDQDWIKFSAVANKTYIIETSNVGANHDAVVFLYNACAAPSLGSEDNAFGQTVHLEWNSTSSGTYYVKLQQHDPAIYGANTNYDISVTVDSMPPSAPKSPRSAPANQALSLQWKKSPELDVTGYRVWFGTTSGVYGGVEEVAGGDTTYYELTGLTNGTLYFVAISAVDFSGNESPKSPEISNIPAAPPDATNPAVTVNQPSTATVYTTTLATLTISGDAQDSGNNLSRVRVRNVTNGTEGWDYGLSGGSHAFYVENVTLQVGDNNIQVTAFDDAGNQGTDSLTIRRLGQSAGAVIIVAGHNGTYGLQSNIYNATNNAYRVFQGAGFGDDDIYYLAPAPQDPDGDGTSEVDATATSANLQSAIETWAATGGRVGPGKPLFLYMMDHGIIEAFCTDGCGSSDRTSSENLNTWLNNLESSTSVDAINVIIETCHSGSFIDRVDNLAASISKAGRVIISSTGRTNNAYASAQGAYFSDAFFSCIVESNSLKTCYDQANTAVSIAGHNQTPWLDDNGDGLSNPSDGTVAQNRYIASSFGSFRPEILDTSVSVVGGSGTLTATVERGAEVVDLVWAAVYAPSFHEPTTTTLDLGVPVLLLQADPDVEGLYSTTYPNGFTEEGTYRVVFYAQDKAEVSAPPDLKTVGERRVYLPVIVRQ